MARLRVKEARVDFAEFTYRAPMKFRATVVDRVTLLIVEVAAEVNGEEAVGFGSMPLGNVWAFPSTGLTFDETLGAMKQLASQLKTIVMDADVSGHPIEINHQLEPLYFDAARQMRLKEPVPALATLVVASAFDAAIHDAYGKAVGKNCYQTYGPRDMDHDLSHYLDERFRGEYLDRYLSPEPKAALHLYHLVGALDALTADDLPQRINDGLPETLEEWVQAEHVSHIKIKLDGNYLEWDVARIVAVDRVLSSMPAQEQWQYSLDFNERCETVEYVLACLAAVSEKAPQAFNRIQYIEQPTNRNLNAPGTPYMHPAAKIKPVVIDESLVDYQSLLRAQELGYTGVALKACKGQSNALLMGAAAQKLRMFLCMQDLTCPGASLLQSVGLAAHITPIEAVESNARQYVPAANRAWAERFPGVFKITDGRFHTAGLNGLGLGVTAAAVHTV